MVNRVGVIQGRLLPKYKDQYQSHPVGYWQQEFPIAASLGLDLIEFILDIDEIEKNPLMSERGIAQIQKITEKTGVKVASVCADCFMDAPLHDPNPAIAMQSIEYLRRLINNASLLNVAYVVIPCLDQSSLRTAEEITRFSSAIESVLELAESKSVNLSLETDLDPTSYSNLLSRFNPKRVLVNYDIGNSTSLGYNPVEEIAAYGSRISGVHIKDRKKGGKSVELGTGDAQFPPFFNALSSIKYKGPFILESYRDDQGLDIFKVQLSWVSRFISEHAEKCSQWTQ
jgi:sugar phosphate isomerase/epimerase